MNSLLPPGEIKSLLLLLLSWTSDHHTGLVCDGKQNDTLENLEDLWGINCSPDIGINLNVDYSWPSLADRTCHNISILIDVLKDV